MALGANGGEATAGTGMGLGQLSDRERGIAEHVAAGMTNREIAVLCFLSEKTVERHLSNIFVKLGVRRRAALASAVVAFTATWPATEH